MIEETLLLFIKATLENEEHLGDNLKKQCIDYVESLQQKNQQQKGAIDMFLDKVDKNKMLLNNPDLLDLYLKITEVSE